MINHHTLVQVGDEKEIYLFIDFGYEFGGDFNFKETNKKMKSLNDKIIKYLSEKQIDFSKGKIFIVVGGAILGTLFINNNQITNIDNAPKDNYQVVEQINIPIEKIEDNIPSQQETVVIEPKVEKMTETKAKSTSIKKETPTTPAVQQEKKKVEKPLPKVEKKKTKVINTKKQITLHRSNGQVVTLELEDYVIGVVGAEMPASFNIEALKAQSIVARTYALKKMKGKEKLRDTTSDQVYKDNTQLKAMWGKDYNKYYNKIKQAVTNTSGEYLTYKGDYIEAVYHSTSNGKTEDSTYVWGNSFPYLKSVDSHWDLQTSSYSKEITKEFNVFKAITGIDLNENTNIEIISRTSGGRINKIKIDDTVFTGIELRMLLGLRSADFDIILKNDKAVFKTRGFGHGVGMSQYGANGMAKEGYSYKNILKHYYPGTILKK